MNTDSTGRQLHETDPENFLKHQKGLLTRLVLLSVVVLLIGQFAVSWFALQSFEQDLSPQLSQKANAVGYAISSEFSYAVGELGIPADELVGVDKYFKNYLQTNEDIAYLALVNEKGKNLFVRGVALDTIEEIQQALSATEFEQGNDIKNFERDVNGYLDGTFKVTENEFGTVTLHVGVTSEHIRSQFFEMFFEILTVIAISWLVTLEFLVFYMRTRVSRPLNQIRTVLTQGTRGVFANRLIERSKDEMGQLVDSFNHLVQDLHIKYNDFVFEVVELREAQIDDKISKKISRVRDQFDKQFVLLGGKDVYTKSVTQIRVPLFLFIFSEEMSRSFLPLFISKYAPTDLFISHEVLVGLPITLFMLVVLIMTPFGGGLVDRFGVRRIFLIGVAAAFVGFVGNYFTQTYVDLIVYRLITGIGYALIFVASEGWIVQNAEEHNRSASTGVFVTAVFVGIVCGPPIGGMVANRIGFESTFLLSAGLAFISGYIIYQTFRDYDDRPERSRTRLILGLNDLITLIKDPRFLSVLFLSSVPAKMMLAGFIAYLVPLYLTDIGHNESSVGRLMMLYGLATLCLVFVVARYADQTRNYPHVIFLGGVVAGLGCLASLFSDTLGIGDTGAVVLAILSLGIGHAMSLTSQNALILMVAESHAATMGRASVVSTYRLFERLGMVMGPLVAVALISQYGYHGAIAGFGVIILVLIALFLIVMTIGGRTSAMSDTSGVMSGV